MKRKGGDSGSVRTVRKNGQIEWKDKDGKRHREDGPAFEWPEKGGRAWYIHGKLHREDGPAMDGPLRKSWYGKGRKHREDGPAVEWADGRKEWYRHGEELTEAEFAALREKELAAIGDAFKKGLDHKVAVKAIGSLKTSSEARKPAGDIGHVK